MTRCKHNFLFLKFLTKITYTRSKVNHNSILYLENLQFYCFKLQIPHFIFGCLLILSSRILYFYEAQIKLWRFLEHQFMTNICPTPIKSIPQSRAVFALPEAIRHRYGEGGAYVWQMCGMSLHHIQIL